MEMIGIVKGLILGGELELAEKMIRNLVGTLDGLKDLERYIDMLNECKKVG